MISQHSPLQGDVRQVCRCLHWAGEEAEALGDQQLSEASLWTPGLNAPSLLSPTGQTLSVRVHDDVE